MQTETTTLSRHPSYYADLIKMATKITPKKYTAVEPPESLPRQTSANFSILVDRTPMYMRAPSRPVVLVQSEYGDKTAQSKLREDFLAGNEKKLVMLVDAQDVDRKWAEAWEAYASDVIAKTVRGKGRSSKNRLVLSPMISFDGDGLHSRLKMSLDPEVLKDCAKELCLDDNMFNLTAGEYGIVFQVTGIWQNATSYGLSLRALRLTLKKEASQTKRMKPSDYEMPNSDDEDDAVKETQD